MNKDEYYLMFNVEKNLWWYKSLRLLVSYYIKKLTHNKLNIKILDAGCGTGMTYEYLNSLDYKMYGIDASEDAVKLCKKRGLKNIRNGSIAKLPYNNSEFDIVLVMDVLGLLDGKSVSETLNETNRVLRPGGYLFIHSAALEFLRSQHDEVSNVKVRYSKSQLAKLFSPSNWNLIKISYRFFFLFIPLALVKLTKRILRLTGIKNHASGDLYLPMPWVNSSLYYLQLMENYLIRFVDFPVGTSLFLIAQKK